MKQFFRIVAILGILLLIVTFKVNDNSIIIYASMEQFRCDELQKQLNEQFKNYNISVMYIPTAKAAAKLQVEKLKSDGDIVVGLESSYMENIKDILADVNTDSHLQYVDGLRVQDHQNKFVTWERQAGAIVVNTEVLKKYNLPTPQTYEDLLKPCYKGLIAMPDPKSSSTGYFFYKSLVNIKGLDQALAYIDQLAVNIKQFTESGSGPIKLLKQGEIAIGLALTFQAVNEINQGQPFKVIYPKEGSPYSITATGILEGRESKKGIKEIFQFIINDFLVYDKEHFSPEQILITQKNTIKNYPTNIPYANMEGIQDIEEKKELLHYWKY